MQNLSHDIEQYILSRLNDEPDNFISLRRKDLAEMFECVPSQINYVLRSRFSPEQGYIIESRRGEHGYIKIVRISCITPQERVNHIDDIIGNSISMKDARKLLTILESREFITQRERLLIEISLRHVSHMWVALISHSREKLIADFLKRLLRGLMLDVGADMYEDEDDD